MLFWSKRDQLRFIDGVERMQAAVNDLVTVSEELKRQAPTRRKKTAEATAAATSSNGDAKGGAA
jgi:hypothetical protein